VVGNAVGFPHFKKGRVLLGKRKMRRLRVCVIVIVLCAIASSAATAQVHQPKMAWGTITTSNAGVPDPAAVTFTAYIQTRPGEMLTKTSVGCSVETVEDATQYIIECGNFVTQWQVNDVLIIEMSGPGGESKTENLILDGSGEQRLDIQLEGPGTAVKLAFTAQPEGPYQAGQEINAIPEVTVQNAAGDTVTSSTAEITIAIGANPAGGTLSGMVTRSAVNGVASFTGLSIDKAGTGYTLYATSPGLIAAESDPFDITAEAELTMAVSPAGSGTTTPPETGSPYTVDIGAPEPIAAAPEPGYQFVSWTAVPPGNVVFDNANSASTTITLSGDATVTANFEIETVNTPTSLIGPASGIVGQMLDFTADGSTSSFGHNVEYRFDWGDGADTISDWGSSTQSYSYPAAGIYNIKAQARCAVHTNVISAWSDALLTITVYDFRLTITIEPPGAGTVTKDPDQPGYNSGQVVELTPIAGAAYTLN